MEIILELTKWLKRPTINKSGFAKELGIRTQHLDVMRKRNNLSETMKEQIIFQLEVEIKAAQNLLSTLKEKH